MFLKFIFFDLKLCLSLNLHIILGVGEIRAFIKFSNRFLTLEKMFLKEITGSKSKAVHSQCTK